MQRFVQRTLLWSLLCLGWPGHVLAQPWSGILAPDRAIDWSQAGVEGGIPTTRTQCGATLASTSTAAQINSAIQACGANQYVQLGAGTFTLSTGLTLSGKNNVTLRGMGADQTILNFTDDDNCFGQRAPICIVGNNLGYYAPGPPTNIVNWTAGYAKGTTVITLSAVPNLSVGMYIVLDQLNDASDTGNIYVCTSASCTDEGGGGNARPTRAQRQMVRVTAISGTDVTLAHPLYMPNWRSSQTPQAWWGSSTSLATGNGVEDFTVNGRSITGHLANVTFLFVTNSWMKGVRSLFGGNPRAHVLMYQSAHITVRDSYLFGSQDEGGASTHYGVEAFGSADCLVENNIGQHRTTAYISNGDTGTVWAYNFAIDAYYTSSAVWMQASTYSHEGGNGQILHEGNVAVSLKGDIVHGTSNLFTLFRNYSIGWETGKTSETVPINLYAYNRYWHAIGNVLGRSVYHTAYETGSNLAIYRLGGAGQVIGADSVTGTTFMRWGNWDVVTSTNATGTNDATGTRFVAGEVPSGLAVLPNPVPGSTTLPASFFRAARPDAWWGTPWGTPAWPAIGPDVSNGNVANVGGHVSKIPAQLCYENSAIDTAVPASNGVQPIVFNASTCYLPVSAEPPPTVPTLLRVVQ